MIDYSRARKDTYVCKFCDGREVTFDIPFGCFVDGDEMAGGGFRHLEVLEERPGLQDRPVLSLYCDSCGCIGGLSEKKL